MTMTFIILTIYALLILSIAIYAYNQTTHYQDYILGGRRFNSVITAMGVAAADMSAWLMLSVPAVFYLYGANQIWLPIGLLLGSFINWQVIAPRLRVYTYIANNSLTLPSFFQHRFFAPSKSGLRLVSALIFMIFFTCYAASGFVGTAKLFTSSFYLDYQTALLISAPIVIFYTAIGGYLAVNWIDLFQGFLMLFALLFLAIIASIHLIEIPMTHAEPSMQPLAISAQELAARFNIFHDLSFIAVISAFGWGLGYLGQPHILARFMSSRGVQEIKTGKYICLTWMVLALVSAALIGIAGYHYFPLGTLSSAEVIFPELAKHLLPSWFSAIVFAAIISAVISTVAAVLFAAASSLVEDVYSPFVRKNASEFELVWVGRAAVLILAFIAIFLAFQGENPSVFDLVSYAWAGLGAAFGPIILMSLFWSRMSYWGALLGLIMGGSVTLLWIIAGYLFTAPIFGLYEIIPGFIAGLIGIIIGSYIKPSHLTEMNQLHQTYLQALITPERRGE